MYKLFDKNGKQVEVNHKVDYLEMLAQVDGYYSAEPPVIKAETVGHVEEEQGQNEKLVEEEQKPSRRGRKPKIQEAE